MSDKSKLIYLGVVTKAHGIQGHVCIKSLTENPSTIVKMPLQDESGNRVSLKLIRVNAEFVVCSVRGVTDRNTAEAMRGTKLFTARSELPKTDESEYYLEDMKGLEVRDESGSILGKILAAHNFGAGDIIEIAFTDGRSEMYPFTKEFFPYINSDYVVFIPIKPYN